MKFKIGDKVKYDGGDWWFYGTVTAIFEHSMSPCYRLSIDRMEKKNCKFAITQFEFELEADNDAESIDNKSVVSATEQAKIKPKSVPVTEKVIASKVELLPSVVQEPVKKKRHRRTRQEIAAQKKIR
jgi:hypothetical protein